MSCSHINFEIGVETAKITDVGRHMLSIRLRCSSCHVPFKFLGMPVGPNLDGASTSDEDGLQAELSVYPIDSEPAPISPETLKAAMEAAKKRTLQ